MIAPASAFVTYLWHYMVARLLYDGLVRGHVFVAALVVAGVALVLALRRHV